MKLMLMIVAATLALTGQASSGQAGAAPTPAQFSAARDALDGKLFDYPSARFREVRADHFRICGLVNGKNQMGAYTGWKTFGVLGSGRTPSVVYFDDRPEDLADLCRDLSDQDHSAELVYRLP
jgi:hypothetical protein